MRFSMKALSTAVVLTVAASAAQAQDVTFVGSTNGSFSGGSAAQTAALTYSGSTFNNTTAGGFAGFGTAPNPGANFNNFGSFMLTNSNFTAGGTFSLNIVFTQPGGIAPGGGTQSFTANLLGTVTSTGNGGVFINFGSPASRTLTFATPTPGGSFTLTVNNVSIDAPAVGVTNMVSLTGNITGAAVVPEPSTYALMGTGLAGLLGMAARRRRSVA